MTQKIVRCPYCVLENGFREMDAINGRFICGKCSHMAAPADLDFKCTCPKCWEMSFPAGLGSTRAW